MAIVAGLSGTTALSLAGSGFPGLPTLDQIALVVQVLSAATLLAAAVALLALRARGKDSSAEIAQAATDAERQRIARDLHDGLAQDLAFIAAYGQRFDAELGPDHPLTVAATRALAASRGALIDLSASRASDSGAALSQVAKELQARFEVNIRVDTVRDGTAGEAIDLDHHQRDEIVRIAREAVVNAIRHGGSRNIDVVLEQDLEGLRLRVCDDGSGIAPNALGKRYGFGLPTMRSRAGSLGGRVTTTERGHGGTELTVTVPA